MKTERLSAELENALLSLLDDTQPAVRKALLAHFSQHSQASLKFLQEVSSGHNRLLAWHARWFLEELKFSDPVAEFKGFIRSLNYELETGALLLSRTVHPEVDIGASCAQLEEMASRCRELIAEPMTTREKCRVINRVLFHDYGFRGDHEQYSDPLNSFLDKVLERRKGAPITLSMIYLLLSQRLGLSLEPVGLPGHFVIGCFVEDTAFFIDPFEQGAFRSREELYLILRANHVAPKATELAPIPVREVLCQCCRNLSKNYQAAGDREHASLFASFVEEFEATYERHSA